MSSLDALSKEVAETNTTVAGEHVRPLEGNQMSSLDVLSKEIAETYTAVTGQHEQIKYYFQIYVAALVGLFTLSGYFSSGGITRDESIIGIISTVTVFFLGWVFLSITAHKVAMIIFFYKHLSVCRGRRLKDSGLDATLMGQYVLPIEKDKIRMPNLLNYLPYLVFAFNFLILCGGVAYYLSPHLSYYQVLACTVAISVMFGTPYPVVCLSFNRHVRCAVHAARIVDLPNSEKRWRSALSRIRPMSRGRKYWTLGVLMFGSIAVAYISVAPVGAKYKDLIIYSSWVGIVLFSAFRFLVERPEFVGNLLLPQSSHRSKNGSASSNPSVQGTRRDKAALRP